MSPEPAASGARIRIGTSGYSYPDWVGPVYPPGTRPADFLDHYRTLFRAVELNFTYYRLPPARTIAAIVKRAGPEMEFSAKLHQSLTHERSDVAEPAAAFLTGLAPLVESGRLGAVLAQFPGSFRRRPESEEYLVELAGRLAGLPLVAEFRHRSWWAPDMFELLRARGVGFCNVDTPGLPGLPRASSEVTSPVGYVRFHGRNARNWYAAEDAHDRYDYLYRAEELAPWVERIRSMARRAEVIYVFTNNHFCGQAVENARMLIAMLDAPAGAGGPRQCGLFPP